MFKLSSIKNNSKNNLKIIHFLFFYSFFLIFYTFSDNRIIISQTEIYNYM